MSLLQRLQKDPEVLKEYDAVIKDQLNRGIVEIVDKKDVGETRKVHYMPHHAVIMRDKQTTKLRIDLVTPILECDGALEFVMYRRFLLQYAK
jgi:hypothetical protein